MILWIASYPKSGNTLLRSMLSAYFFSTDGIYNFDLIKNIKQFPNIALFENLDIDSSNEEEVIKNYIKVQEIFNKKNSVQFTKTHSCLFNYKEKYPFTNLNNTLGVIYVVRDPRNIVTSYANHHTRSQEYVADMMIKKSYMGGNLDVNKSNEDRTTVHTGTWANNFQTWKSFNNVNKYLLIKYEDLTNDPELVFNKILEFIYNLNKTKFDINKKKFNNVIKTTSFKYMQNLENEYGFIESKINPETNKMIRFFNLGPENNWKNSLDTKIVKKIEIAFKKEMVELGYL